MSCWRTTFYYAWLIFDALINIYLLYLVMDAKGELVTEPSGVINSDWKWLNNFIYFYTTLTAIAIVISLTLIVLSLIYFKTYDCFCIRSCCKKPIQINSKKSSHSKLEKIFSELKEDKKYLLRVSFYTLLLLTNIITFSLATFSVLNLFAYKSCTEKHCNEYCDEVCSPFIP